MSQEFYSHARLYDLMFSGGGPAVDFYRTAVDRQGGHVLELGCGTGQKLIPIASDGHPCAGLDFSSDMLAEAQRKASERDVEVEWVQGDMRSFDLDRIFDFVFITANSLLHLHAAEDLVSCFRSVRKHLAPGARFVFDVFNPSVRLLAEADGVRRTRETLSFVDPADRKADANAPLGAVEPGLRRRGFRARVGLSAELDDVGQECGQVFAEGAVGGDRGYGGVDCAHQVLKSWRDFSGGEGEGLAYGE